MIHGVMEQIFPYTEESSSLLNFNTEYGMGLYSLNTEYSMGPALNIE